jgi:LysM repeat protein
LVLDHGRLLLGAPSAGSLRLDRSIGQAALIVLMVIAFAAILVARLTAGDPGSAGVAGATGTPGPSATVVPGSPAPTPVPSAAEPSLSATPGSSDPAPSAAPTTDPTPPPAGAVTYVVQSGDTLSGIAAEFGTTWQILAELNGIEDPGRLQVGQELQLP